MRSIYAAHHWQPLAACDGQASAEQRICVVQHVASAYCYIAAARSVLFRPLRCGMLGKPNLGFQQDAAALHEDTARLGVIGTGSGWWGFSVNTTAP